MINDTADDIQRTDQGKEDSSKKSDEKVSKAPEVDNTQGKLDEGNGTTFSFEDTIYQQIQEEEIRKEKRTLKTMIQLAL